MSSRPCSNATATSPRPSGYFVEVPQSVGEGFTAPPLNTTFIHRQTMIDAMRFSTAELASLDAKIASAADGAIARENALFDALAAEVLAAAPILDGIADAAA